MMTCSVTADTPWTTSSSQARPYWALIDDDCSGFWTDAVIGAGKKVFIFENRGTAYRVAAILKQDDPDTALTLVGLATQQLGALWHFATSNRLTLRVITSLDALGQTTGYPIRDF